MQAETLAQLDARVPLVHRTLDMPEPAAREVTAGTYYFEGYKGQLDDVDAPYAAAAMALGFGLPLRRRRQQSVDPQESDRRLLRARLDEVRTVRAELAGWQRWAQAVSTDGEAGTS
ncbi:hypothetical protein [Streptomyces flavochromogenes]|uniref:hypothetical protein n=1 Tax=Streptomyces flavochromogenes TaxID=68199 RepID=UPI000A783D77|nr:hypothetical protein [Streptomyces flavochromogenes]